MAVLNAASQSAYLYPLAAAFETKYSRCCSRSPKFLEAAQIRTCSLISKFSGTVVFWFLGLRLGEAEFSTTSEITSGIRLRESGIRLRESARSVPSCSRLESDDYEIHDWAVNNMNWRDVKDHAIQIERPSLDYEDGWVNGEYEVKAESKEG